MSAWGFIRMKQCSLNGEYHGVGWRGLPGREYVLVEVKSHVIAGEKLSTVVPPGGTCMLGWDGTRVSVPFTGGRRATPGRGGELGGIPFLTLVHSRTTEQTIGQ